MKHEVRNKTIFSGTLTTLTLILLCMACEKEGQEAEIPAYLYLQPFELRSQEAGQGSASEKITEAWLSVDGAFLGAYSLPALVPVLGEGTREISLQAGIRDNGIGRTPEVYPFYETFRTTRDLQTNSIDTIRPVIGYLDRARFSLIDATSPPSCCWFRISGTAQINRFGGAGTTAGSPQRRASSTARRNASAASRSAFGFRLPGRDRWGRPSGSQTINRTGQRFR